MRTQGHLKVGQILQALAHETVTTFKGICNKVHFKPNDIALCRPLPEKNKEPSYQKLIKNVKGF